MELSLTFHVDVKLGVQAHVAGDHHRCVLDGCFGVADTEVSGRLREEAGRLDGIGDRQNGLVDVLVGDVDKFGAISSGFVGLGHHQAHRLASVVDWAVAEQLLGQRGR